MPATHSTLKTCLATAALWALHLGTTAANATPFVPVPESNAAELEFGSLLSDELAFSGDAAASAPTPPWSIAQVFNLDTSPFMASVDRVASRSSDPVRTRRSLLLAMQMSNMCYSPNLTPEEMDALIAATGLQPAALTRFQNRFNLAGTVWTGDGLQGPSGRSTRARLT